MPRFGYAPRDQIITPAAKPCNRTLRRTTTSATRRSRSTSSSFTIPAWPRGRGRFAGSAIPRPRCRATTSSSRTGGSVQLVDEGRRAWHAGKSWWAGETDINSRSVGIEIVNPGHEFGYRPFPEVQIEAVIALCREIIARHPIPPERVLAHSDVAPTRKEDPGELFPWRQLRAAGVGHWVSPAPIVDGPILRAR